MNLTKSVLQFQYWQILSVTCNHTSIFISAQEVMYCCYCLPVNNFMHFQLLTEISCKKTCALIRHNFSWIIAESCCGLSWLRRIKSCAIRFWLFEICLDQLWMFTMIYFIKMDWWHEQEQGRTSSKGRKSQCGFMCLFCDKETWVYWNQGWSRVLWGICWCAHRAGDAQTEHMYHL